MKLLKIFFGVFGMLLAVWIYLVFFTPLASPVFDPPPSYSQLEDNSTNWQSVGYTFVEAGTVMYPNTKVNYGKWIQQFQVKAPLAHVISKVKDHCPEPEWTLIQNEEVWEARCDVQWKGRSWLSMRHELGAFKEVKVLPGKYRLDELEKVVKGTESTWTTIYISANEPNSPDIYTREYQKNVNESR